MLLEEERGEGVRKREASYKTGLHPLHYTYCIDSIKMSFECYNVDVCYAKDEGVKSAAIP